ncbi:chemotaxis response regulator protein-glutamate methylesterase [Veronia pacifica]|uniref:Protein-glutamate methylesterase/protein-glutamine glutaminase n=1 Tax=Veronia pacifica TaxID=1080227 RepID=A0A1C3EJ08_9GAMM|nr:chemotaxis response regulator protein-glutamate methylesterase [Veronia pacifica]ODA33231.1 chemotaxis response regulator protein-glutamate methylesterase [Veronia pacifica]
MKKRRIKVLVVDDSAVFRALLTDILESDPQLKVVAGAEDPYEARELIKKLKPDVLTLDVEMPRMDGVQFLRNLMRLHPLPVVMLSTLTQHKADVTLASLEIGAVDYLPKPTKNLQSELESYREVLIEKVKMAAKANLTAHAEIMSGPSYSKIDISAQRFDASLVDVIAIGASTGGTEALKVLLKNMPAKMPPIVITQHIKAVFSKSFADRLNRESALHVEELTNKQSPLIPGRVYVAPGDKHIEVIKKGQRFYCRQNDGDPVLRHKPSVDVMFQSVVKAAGGRAVGILLTGMGRDGADGMKAMHTAGAVTLAQDELTSVVWGMPRVAIEMGAATHVMPLKKITPFLVEMFYHS